MQRWLKGIGTAAIGTALLKELVKLGFLVWLISIVIKVWNAFLEILLRGM